MIIDNQPVIDKPEKFVFVGWKIETKIVFQWLLVEIILQKYYNLFELIKKSDWSQRSQTDKFAFILTVWYRFFENSQNN